MKKKLSDDRGRKTALVRLQQMAEIHKRYLQRTPWWRRSIIGYLLAVPFVGLGLLVIMGEQSLLPHFYFSGTPMLLCVLLVALIWGVGPALFAVVLSTLALDYFSIPPSMHFDLTTREGILQVLPFLVAGIVVAIITGQREAARTRALIAEEIVREDIDALALANERLEQANASKDQFLSMASHELKTPLTTIRGQAQIALRRMRKQRDIPAELEMVRTALGKIEEQTYRLNTLIDDFMDVSRIQAGKLELRLKECNLEEVCREVVEDQRFLTGRAIELRAPQEPVVLKADAERLSQVVVNLISNAIKYSPTESLVEVYIGQHGKVAVIEVQDGGAGIPKDQQTRIFEPFYRTPNAEASAARGSGLGLAICKDIVERHGGHIYYELRGGKDSTFVVELPLRL